MKAILISAALLGVMTAGASYAAAERSRTQSDPGPVLSGEGGGGGRGTRVASAVGTTLLFVPEAAQSSLIAVGEGGEGGEGGRGKRSRKKRHRGYAPYYGGYEPYRGRAYPPEDRRWRLPGSERPYPYPRY